MSSIRGMVTPVVTPLTSHRQVDVPALKAICETQIAAGIDAIFVLGTTGEFYGLTRAQRRLVVETALEAVGGRVPVLAGISGDSTASSLDALECCRHDGLAAYVASTPYFLSYTQDELLDYFREMSDAAGAPVLLYNYPGRYRHVIGHELIEKLLSEGRIRGIKDTQGDIAYMRCLLEIKRSYPEFAVFEGALPNLGQSARLGVDGSVQALGNLLPHQCAELWRLAKGDEWDSLDEAVARMWEFHQAIEQVVIFIAAMKGCMAIRGWCKPFAAAPTAAVSGEQMGKLRGIMVQSYPDLLG